MLHRLVRVGLVWIGVDSGLGWVGLGLFAFGEAFWFWDFFSAFFCLGLFKSLVRAGLASRLLTPFCRIMMGVEDNDDVFSLRIL